MNIQDDQHWSLPDASPVDPGSAGYLVTPLATLDPERLVQYPPWIGHIPFAFWLIDVIRPRCLVELGTASGNSYCAFLQAIKVLGIETQCFAVDHWQGDPHSAFYTDDSMLTDLARHHDPRYGAFSTLLQKDFDTARADFADGTIDLLHIDGFHTYDAVRHDFESWLPKLSGRGVVLFHDVAVRNADFGVWRFWEEVRARYPAFSFVHSHGLGVIYVGREPMLPALQWLLGEDTAVAPARRTFAALGRAVMDRFVLSEQERQQAEAAAQRERLVAERDAAVAAQSRHDARLSDLTQVLAAQEAEKQAFRIAVADLRDRVEATGLIAAGRLRLIEEKRAELRLRDAAIAERDGLLSSLASQLAQAETAADARATAAVASDVANLHNLLAAYHTSTSWKLTRPLRVAMRFAKGRLPHRPETRHDPVPPVAEVPFQEPAEQPAPAASAAPAPPQVRDTHLVTHPAFAREALPRIDIAVSVVIPTYNAGGELALLARKLLQQQGLRSVEVVIVDSGSTDGTAELAAECGCRVVGIRKDEFTHSYARNLGAQHATGDVLVFMVQDAYPIGDRWLYGLAQALTRPLPSGETLAAVSCAEYSRTDSELLYDSLLYDHYQFLRCGDRDKVGRLTTTDHAALRQQGQLSDVACMIRRSLFREYGYHGNYAEDLGLGIKLIQDGHLIAMLSSIRVIHSHRRPASYFVRRVFVDVVFLVATFPDHPVPMANSVTGSLMAALAVRRAVKPIAPSGHITPAQALQTVIATVQDVALPDRMETLREDGLFGFPPLTAWVEELSAIAIPSPRPLKPREARDAVQVRAMIAARMQGLAGFLQTSRPELDESTAAELNAAVDKIIAMTLGAQLAHCYLSPLPSLDDDGVESHVHTLKHLLVAGI